jgi:hypothetical protein
MTLGDAFAGLRAATRNLADVLCAVRVTVCEDRPDGTATLSVDELTDAIVELAGEAEALRDRVRTHGCAELSGPEAESLVSLAQSTINNIADGLSERVLACDRLAEVERSARRAGSAWHSWWAATERGLIECEPAVRDVRDKLFACWRELIARPSPPVGTAVPLADAQSRGGANT